MVFNAVIIGCGRIGSEFDDDPKRKVISSHAGAYSNNPQTKLVAIADLNEEKRNKCKARWNVPNAYSDYKEMLNKEKIDILSICTWSATHCDILREAVKHDIKAIFCEKPIATTLAEADEMVGLCKEKNILLIIDHQRRFDPFHQDIRKMIMNGELGKIQQATFYYTAGIANTGSHALDLLRFCLGDAEWVQATYSESLSPNPEDPNIDALVKFKSGPIVALQAGDVKEFLMFELRILGSKGGINITRSGFDGEFYVVEESDLFSGYKELYQKPFPLDKNGSREFMKYAMQHIVECIKDKKKPISSGEDSRASFELICALHESAKEDGKRIRLPLKQSDIVLKSR